MMSARDAIIDVFVEDTTAWHPSVADWNRCVATVQHLLPSLPAAEANLVPQRGEPEGRVLIERVASRLMILGAIGGSITPRGDSTNLQCDCGNQQLISTTTEDRPCVCPSYENPLGCDSCRATLAVKSHKRSERCLPSFNATHSGGVVLCAALRCMRRSRGVVGADLMELLPRDAADIFSERMSQRLASRLHRSRKTLTPKELKWVQREDDEHAGICHVAQTMLGTSHPPPLSIAVTWVRWCRFLFHWCLKEAVLKGIGCGLLVEPAAVEVHVDPSITDVDDPLLFHRWQQTGDLVSRSSCVRISMRGAWIHPSPSLFLLRKSDGRHPCLAAVTVLPSSYSMMCSHSQFVFGDLSDNTSAHQSDDGVDVTHLRLHTVLGFDALVDAAVTAGGKPHIG